MKPSLPKLSNSRTANILDPVHEALDTRVWDDPISPTPSLKPQHKKWIHDRIYRALDDAGYTHIESWLKLYLTGSLTTYQYSDESDCDISLFVDVETFPEWSRAEMIGLMVENVDGAILPGTPHPMQDFVVGRGIRPTDLYRPGLRSGYDLQTDTWIEPPDRSRVHDIQTEMHNLYTKGLEAADKMERLLRYDPARATMYWHQIHHRRQRDQVRGLGDFTESNVIYKMLANRGLFDDISQATGEYIARIASEVPFVKGDRIRIDNPESPAHGATGEYLGPDPYYAGSHHVKLDGHPENWFMHDELEPEIDTTVPQEWEHPDPWMDNEPGTLTFPEGWNRRGANWSTEFTNLLGPIAEAYKRAPMYQPEAESAWHELAADSEQRANQLRQQYNITETDDPEPYADAHEMFRDLNQGNFVVSRANSEHPIWTPDQNVNFRIAHDVLGHHPTGGDFSWQGENQACGAHFPLLTPNARRALFSECIGQTAYANQYKGFGPQKTSFIDHVLPHGVMSAVLPHGGFCHRHRRHGIYNGVTSDSMGVTASTQYNVIESQTPPWQSLHYKEYGGDPSEFDHRPWVVSGNNLYLGQQGTHHVDLTRDFGVGSAGNYWEGSGGIQPDGEVWSNEDINPPHEYRDVVNTLANHLGEAHATDYEEWKIAKLALGDPRNVIVRKWVYDPDTGKLNIGNEGAEEGENLNHAQLGKEIDAGSSVLGGTISNGWAAVEFGGGDWKVRRQAQEALREAVPDLLGFLGGEVTDPTLPPQPVGVAEPWAL